MLILDFSRWIGQAPGDVRAPGTCAELNQGDGKRAGISFPALRGSAGDGSPASYRYRLFTLPHEAFSVGMTSYTWLQTSSV